MAAVVITTANRGMYFSYLIYIQYTQLALRFVSASDDSPLR